MEGCHPKDVIQKIGIGHDDKIDVAAVGREIA